MKTAEEILKVCSEEFANCKVEYPLTHNGIIKAMKEYAKQAIEEQLIIAAGEVELVESIRHSAVYDKIDLFSIINCTRLELK